MKTRTSHYSQILEETFFRHRDRGTEAEQTPLFKHHAGVLNLIPKLSEETGLPDDEIREMLKDAYEEVKL